jgi:DNA-binding transcriptional LysR family regulator
MDRVGRSRTRSQCRAGRIGLTYVLENLAQPHLAQGRLKRVLEVSARLFPGYHLYYPSRRRSSPHSPC